MRIIEGVTLSLNQKMEAVKANVVCSDGMLLRTCEHGVRHPVGHLHQDDLLEDQVKYRHEREPDPGEVGLDHRSACCEAECCQRWFIERIPGVEIGRVEGSSDQVDGFGKG